MGEVTVSNRALVLNGITDIEKSWDIMKSAMRPDLRDDLNITKAQTAFSVELYDSGINYFWNLTINDLKKKIIAYGIEYFTSTIGWDGRALNNIDDLDEIKDHYIITGVHSLGIINEESLFYLNQNREIRNKFSVAHYPIAEIDKLESYNFIKNCIKYVLSNEPPIPGLQIKDVLNYLETGKVDDFDELEIMLLGQSNKIYPSLINAFFSEFIKNDCDLILKYNIKKIAPILWRELNEDSKYQVASRYLTLKDRPTKEQATEAFEFLKECGGLKYIPDNVLAMIFNRFSKNLIDAHYSFNNYHLEPRNAQALYELGSDIPSSSLKLYVKTTILSYTGNYYGVSMAAQLYNISMISNLSNIGIQMLFKVATKDKDILLQLTNEKPVRRLKELMELIKDKTLLSDDQIIMDRFINDSVSRIIKDNKNIIEKL